MRVLVIDPAGNALDWVMRAQGAGHDVKWHVTMLEKNKYLGRGLVTRVPDPREWFKWAELIFLADNTKWLHEVDKWRKLGWPVIGPSLDAAQWELDRTVGMKVLRKANVAVPPVKNFTDYPGAIAYVKREMRRFVSKPSGDADKSLSYCAKSPADMVYMLERWQKHSMLKTPFILQDFVPGIEMAVGGWYGPGGFNEGWCENFEFKKLMNDDLGVATGEQGTVLRYAKKSKLADKVLKPVEDQLDAIGFTGYIDVNCIIAEDGTPYPLEFTMRPGWPTFNIQQALLKGDPVEWLAQLVEGRDARNWEMETVACGVVLSIPDYPYSNLTKKEVTGVPIYGLKPSILPSIHPCEMMLTEKVPVEKDGRIMYEPMWTTAGDYVLVASATGETVDQARKKSYRILKTLSVPNSPMWRTDIGLRLRKQLPELQSMGYATGMTF